MAKRHGHRSIHASPPLRSPTNWMKAFLFLKTTHRAWAPVRGRKRGRG